MSSIVRGLLAHKTRGNWSNTQENAFILLALDRYFNEFEKVTPDFVARVWLGDGFAGEQKLTLQKDGKGRLYYRIGMRYAPKDLELATSASRRSRLSCGTASTSTPTSPAPPRPAPSSSPRPARRRCTAPRRSAAAPRTS
jgi:hypothetical protein